MTGNHRFHRPRPSAGLAVILLIAVGCAAPGVPVIQQGDWAPAPGVRGVRLETEHYDLRITATDPVMREVLPTFLETTFAEYRRLMPPPEGRPGKLETYLFDTREQWAAFTRRFVPQRAHIYLHIKAGGYVDHQTATAVIWDLGRDTTLSLLAHEGFHQYVAKFFPEPVVPWLNEGLATQWEAFDLKAGRPTFTPRLNYYRRNSLREALSSPEGWIPLQRLLTMNAGEAVVQTGQATRGYYAQVWSLVLFLQHRGFGGYARAFENLLRDAGTERMRNRVREYASNTSATAGLGQGEAIFRCYITDDTDFFERQYREFCRKLVR